MEGWQHQKLKHRRDPKQVTKHGQQLKSAINESGLLTNGEVHFTATPTFLDSKVTLISLSTLIQTIANIQKTVSYFRSLTYC